MRLPALLIALSIFLIFCKDNQRLAPLTKPHRPKSDKYDSLLQSLSKYYVLHIASAGRHRADLIKSFNKTAQEVSKDSIEYHSAVKAFYVSDTSILSYLLSFRGSNNYCSFLGSPHPYSSNIPEWGQNCTEERGAAVLIYDYLAYNAGTLPPILPKEIDMVINRYNLPVLAAWIKSNAGPLKEMREKFLRDSAYFQKQVKRDRFHRQ